ncbi:E3 ubiquitin-protein ligase RHF2A-like isoform X6 [Olea europaea var. sylvestris]|uniref:E3 ubiquitin-protein ligase RHF2A-like isoform X6 n=1 Tax=Olea europaea var. sylvestris TaxID=158386 RepID=UPI000C1D82A4|nr:E3 ubiquitin-protein ligase RHF2A-like isoform X6 [Olea europaea var. sylvestris]
MEVPGTEEVKKSENHEASAAAFVEGGIQESCDDACSICLEAFSVTSCKHEFHLQCILEWCQRSSNCPMCWQPLGLKDPACHELLEAVEWERSSRVKPSRNATIFHYPTLGDFELQHLPVEVHNPELQDHIIQQLTAAAAAMGRSHHIARRESSRSHSSGQASLTPGGGVPVPASATLTNPSHQLTFIRDEQPQHMPSSVQSNGLSASSSGSFILPTGQRTSNDNRSYESQSSLSNLDRAGPSELQSFSDTWKSRFSAISMKYKESISKSTRGLKEKLFSRSSSMADIGSEVRREVNAGIATVSRMMEHLETRDNNRDGRIPLANSPVDSSVSAQRNHDDMDTHNEVPLDNNNSAAFATSSV